MSVKVWITGVVPNERQLDHGWQVRELLPNSPNNAVVERGWGPGGCQRGVAKGALQLISDGNIEDTNGTPVVTKNKKTSTRTKCRGSFGNLAVSSLTPADGPSSHLTEETVAVSKPVQPRSPRPCCCLQAQPAQQTQMWVGVCVGLLKAVLIGSLA